MKIILSTNGYQIQVDDCYYEYLNQFNWGIDNKGYPISGMNKGSGSYFGLHRVVAELAGMDTSNLIDHKDRNPLNNQVSNLRPANKSQNCSNAIKSPGQYSEYRGVSYNKRRGKYTAQIKKQMRKVHLGTFENELDAAKAYDKAAVEHFGEFAVLNFPEDY